ncbi:hypothetical protein FSW04_00025 [Baekduia soli]|uniref:Uncharacterized protein n=1 Tax=Baekduia soli TaxID=496014 RepID=A0A5B8TZF6_9ACTN|nr:hypothetical protein [Baekduia soli]QEC46106.1 hypothetical protein FSW04_00025 [Baekduia soli]
MLGADAGLAMPEHDHHPAVVVAGLRVQARSGGAVAEHERLRMGAHDRRDVAAGPGQQGVQGLGAVGAGRHDDELARPRERLRGGRAGLRHAARIQAHDDGQGVCGPRAPAVGEDRVQDAVHPRRVGQPQDRWAEHRAQSPAPASGPSSPR